VSRQISPRDDSCAADGRIHPPAGVHERDSLLPGALGDQLELGNHFDILRPADGALVGDERLQTQAEATGAEQLYADTLVLQILEPPTSDDFTEEVDRTDVVSRVKLRPC
jgi:hypothetical protein